VTSQADGTGGAAAGTAAAAEMGAGVSSAARARADGALTGFRALPLAIQLVVLFFVFDCFEKAAHLAMALGAAPAGLTMRYFVDECLPLVLGVLFNALLALQIGLRTRAGRFWGIVYLLALTGVSIALLVEKPERWIEMGAGGRLREIATWAINLFLAACLFGRAGRRALVR
jgi:hypothetical protein